MTKKTKKNKPRGMQMTKKTEEKQTARDANDTKHVTQKRNRAGTEAQHRKPNRGDAQKNAYKKQGRLRALCPANICIHPSLCSLPSCYTVLPPPLG
jgi:hypothetical protein